MHVRAALALAIATSLLATAPASACSHYFGSRYARVGSGEVSASAPAIVLGFTNDHETSREEPAPTQLRLGEHALSVETLAPGLVVARSSAAIHEGALSLTGLTRPLSVSVAATTPAAALTAPEIVSLRVGRAELRTPPPPSAVAVVVALDGTPIAWEPITMPSTHLRAGRSPLCASLPDGYREPRVGDVVTFAWVDASGTLSPPSSPVRVERRARP